MKLLTNFFSSAATKRPVITILVVLLLTGFFGYMAGQAEDGIRDPEMSRGLCV